MNKRMKILAGAGAAALLAGGAALWAQAPHGGPLERFDADRNGRLTLAEMQSGVGTMFATADVDKDGKVTRDEMRAAHAKMGHGSPRGGHGGRDGGPPKEGAKRGGPMHLDTDGDGSVSLPEAQAEVAKHFAQLDGNKDGSVTRAEAGAAHRAKMGRN